MGVEIIQKGYKQLKVWKQANHFVLLVYKVTMHFPKAETYGLVSQVRRSALSIPANIVEGQASSSKREFLNFLNIANRSLVETEYLLEVACELGYLTKEDHEDLDVVRREVGYLLCGLSRSVKSRL